MHEIPSNVASYKISMTAWIHETSCLMNVTDLHPSYCHNQRCASNNNNYDFIAASVIYKRMDDS